MKKYNEQGPIAITPEAEQKIFDAKDLEGKDYNEQAFHIDDALAKLDLISGDVKNALGDTELERIGNKGVTDKASIFDKIKLGVLKSVGAENVYDQELTKTAKKVAEKNLGELERSLGSDILDLKEKITTHEMVSKNDIDAIKNLPGIDEGLVKSMEIKMEEEKNVMLFDKNNKEEELQARITEYPAFQKQEKIINLMSEYGAIEKSVTEKRLTLDSNIRGYEAAYSKIKGEGGASQEIKEHLESQLEILKKQSVEMIEKERAVKERIALLKENKRELDPFVKRLEMLGKTPAEINDAKNQVRAERAAGDNAQEEKKSKTVGSSNVNFENANQVVGADGEAGEERYKKYPKEWAELFHAVSPAMADKSIITYFNKIGLNSINDIEAKRLMAKFFLESKKVKTEALASNEAELIFNKVSL